MCGRVVSCSYLKLAILHQRSKEQNRRWIGFDNRVCIEGSTYGIRRISLHGSHQG